MNTKRKRLIVLVLLLIAICGCSSQKDTIIIDIDSEKMYQSLLIWGKNEEECYTQYDPQPDKIIPVQTKVHSTKAPFVRSASFASKIKTIFRLLDGESIPQKPLVKNICLYHYYNLYAPLKKGDDKTFLFDAKGNFIGFGSFNYRQKKTE